MDATAALLKEQYDNHPDMEIQDAIKFLYQRHLGPGHLVDDEARSLAQLEAEWAQVEGDPSAPLLEPLGGNICRLSLSACKGKELSTHTINRLFVMTALECKPDWAALEKDLNLVYKLPFSQEKVDDYLRRYRADGSPPVGHSAAYRKAYRPAYRVVFSHYVNLIPILAVIDQLMETHTALRVAIDGPCASGKSTLGALLAQVYRCPLLHMDDFFLQPQQRTEERLAQPGGNVDYERFDTEVLSPLRRGQPARYRPWQCRTQCFGPEVAVAPGPLVFVEGSYSLHPNLREQYQLRLWVEAPWPVRLDRLAQRGGPDCVTRFQQLWIPMEERYFSACQVKACCHRSVSGSHLC